MLINTRLLIPLFILSLILSPRAVAETKAVASTGMIGDLVRGVGGESLQVEDLMTSGVDPHLYKPTRSDILRLSRADIAFYNGLFLEGKMLAAFQRLAKAGKKTIAVAELLDKSYLLSPPEFQGHPDPHVWMDPRAWAKVADEIARELIEFNPSDAPAYRTGLKNYKTKLEALDAYAETVLKSVPEKRRILVTAHDAFGYFGRRFDFEVVGIQGISTQSEAGIRDIERIVSLLVERKIEAIFVESTVSDRNVQALIEGASKQGHRVRIGGELFSDAMGKPGTYEGTYLGMIDHNVTTIARALGGKAPAKGFQGLLSGARH
jgi:manganese/zinc/iron transport system substrate-binding protein